MARSGLARFGYISAFVALGCSLALWPTRTGAVAQAGSASPDFAGNYDFFASGGTHYSMMLSTDGTFQTSDGDQGTWGSMDNAVVLSGYYNARAGPCLYLGTATNTGINAKRHQGPSDCTGNRAAHWYAVRTGSSAAAATETARQGRATGRRASVRAKGKYSQTDTIPDYPTAALTIKPDGSDIQAHDSSSDYNFGYWAVQDGVIAFDVESSQSGSNADCVFLGQLSRTGIGSSGAPGVVSCDGTLYSWSAVRTKT